MFYMKDLAECGNLTAERLAKQFIMNCVASHVRILNVGPHITRDK